MMEQPAVGLPSAPRGIRWRPLAVVGGVVVAVLAVAGAIAGYLWLNAYMPIRLAGTGGPAPGSLEHEVVHDRDMTGITTYVASGEAGGDFGVIFDVVNAGRLPITIEGLGGDTGGGDSLFPPVELHRAGRPGASDYDTFSAVTLEQGETAFLGFQVVAAADTCDHYAPNASMVWDTVTLRYSYAGVFSRDATLDLPIALELVC